MVGAERSRAPHGTGSLTRIVEGHRAPWRAAVGRDTCGDHPAAVGHTARGEDSLGRFWVVRFAFFYTAIYYYAGMSSSLTATN